MKSLSAAMFDWFLFNRERRRSGVTIVSFSLNFIGMHSEKPVIEDKYLLEMERLRKLYCIFIHIQ
jgi:hypothetical protein